MIQNVMLLLQSPAARVALQNLVYDIASRYLKIQIGNDPVYTVEKAIYDLHNLVYKTDSEPDFKSFGFHDLDSPTSASRQEPPMDSETSGSESPVAYQFYRSALIEWLRAMFFLSTVFLWRF